MPTAAQEPADRQAAQRELLARAAGALAHRCTKSGRCRPPPRSASPAPAPVALPGALRHSDAGAGQRARRARAEQGREAQRRRRERGAARRRAPSRTRALDGRATMRRQTLPHSYARARSTSSRAARRAGHSEASIPASAAPTTSASSVPIGNVRRKPSASSGRLIASANSDAEHEPEQRADQRRDDGLQAHDPLDLAARHADRAQQPELARALEDRQRERVDDPEQRRRSATAPAARR